MRINIRLFGRLREMAGAPELQREVEEPATVGSVWTLLAAEFPPMAPYERAVSAAVNADFARMSSPLVGGDEVAFLPPVSGG